MIKEPIFKNALTHLRRHIGDLGALLGVAGAIAVIRAHGHAAVHNGHRLNIHGLLSINGSGKR